MSQWIQPARRRTPLLLAAWCGLLASVGAAQDAPLTGYGTAASARQRALERAAIERIAPATLDSFSHALTREPHVAGSPAQARTRDWVLAQTRSWGLPSEAPGYRVYLPWATTVEVELVAPERRRLQLAEEPLPDDPVSALPQYPWANGYTGVGEAEGDLVYVNYGLHEDYAALDSLGVSVAGKIAIARYGRSYRGIKARLAQERGAGALLIYSDPMDDGYFRGDTYPHGTFRSASAAQRGSIKNGPGDPSTPLWSSVAGARRVEPGSTAGVELARIPVVPLSYGAAEPLLRALQGDLPEQGWQGALPFRYHVGPGPARVRVKVEDDRALTEGYKDIWNTIAWLRGAERPDEWVIVGAHRDAWNAGANDNVSGTSTVLAAARALAELARAGQRPRRTIVFATWDAEEWGLIGAAEWVEQHAATLASRGVAYINQDAIASGTSFQANAAPSLKQLVRDATLAVPAPDGGTLYHAWRERQRASDTADITLGNLGGGSDFAPFYNHAAIPSADWGFGGGWGQYHAAYDTYAWMSRFGDPGYTRHTTSAQLAAVVALRLANAEILPYDYDEFARELRGVVLALIEAAREQRLEVATLGRLDQALAALGQAAREFAGTRDGWLKSARGRAAAAQADAANRQLMQVERALARPEGLPGRPWYRYLIFAADARNGYATLALPGVAEAIRAGDAAGLTREAEDLAARLDTAAAHLRSARTALGAGS